MSRVTLIWVPLVLVTLALFALAAHKTRRAFIRTFFADGIGDARFPPRLDGNADRGGLAPAARIRVVLLDGLGLAVSRELPALSALCKRGLELRVDTGFPTVSLPVQHALWTGLTQQQSGVQYRINGITPPLQRSTPGQVAGSAAVAESHLEIARSFAFQRVLPSPLPAGALPPGWRESGFVEAAAELSRSEARLVFVHVLRIDEAGHHHGARSAEYRRAAVEADALLARLLAETPAADTAWFVLADHGHLPAGGHADAEESVRKIRACLVGAHPLPALPADQIPEIHLIDLARALAETAGAPLHPESRARPLSEALRLPAPDATLPSPSVPRWIAAIGILFLAGAIGLRLGGAPLWLPASYLCIALFYGIPTLSNRIVYPPLGLDMIKAALPGLLFFFLPVFRKTRRFREDVLPTALGQLALPLGAALASLILCGGLQRLLGLSSAPPLYPLWSGHTSLFLSLLIPGALLASLSVLAGAVRAGSDRSAPSDTADTARAAPPPYRAETQTDRGAR